MYVDVPVAGIRTGIYNTIVLEPPYEANKYIDAIHTAEEHNMEVIITDSLTHAWSGEGGALDKQGKVAARTGNSYTAWREVTPEHNRLVDTLLQSKAHIIADIRAKTDYSQIKDERGKTTVKNVGLAPVFRDGIEYEFTVCFMLDSDHIANATKDRTSMFDGKYFVITPSTGKIMYEWLAGGCNVDEKPKQSIKKVDEVVAEKKEARSTQSSELPDEIPVDPAQSSKITMDMVDEAIKKKCIGITLDEKKQIAQEIKSITGGTANYRSITDPVTLKKLYDKYKE